METEEGKERGVNFNHVCNENQEFSDYKQFLGKEIIIKASNEPSDIIWENRKLSDSLRQRRRIISVIVLVATLFISFILIFLATKKQFELTLKYPPTDCDHFEEHFGNNME